MIAYADGRASPALLRLQREEKRLAGILVEFCETRGLAPFLVAGSALGAWRDGDFIAWDDDIDLGMVRSDFEAFVAAWIREPQQGISLQSHHTEPGYPLAYAKLRLDGTRVVEDAAVADRHHQGIFIDIFPFDVLPRSPLLRRVQQLALEAINLFVMSYSHQVAMNSQLAGLRLLRLLALALRPLVPVRKLIGLRERFNRMAWAEGSDELACFEMYGIRFARRTWVRREVLVPPQRAAFGELTMPVPAQCDAYLTGVFGDYRRLPPEDRRQPLHVRAVDFGDRTEEKSISDADLSTAQRH
jgi:lipopolysaccharide cholinephosphotransferase